VVNSAKELAAESGNPDKVARVTALLQQFVLEGKDMLVKAKDNSPSFLSSKVQLTQTLRSVVLALSESDPTPSSRTQPQQHTSTTSTTSSSPPIYSSTPTTGSIPAADRARVRLNSFLSSLGRPRAQSYNDQGSFTQPRIHIFGVILINLYNQGQFVKGITSANSHLALAIQVFNSLNDYSVAEERRRSFQYEEFASQSIKFGEQLNDASSFSSNDQVREALHSTARTLSTASLHVVDSIEKNVDVTGAREMWGQILTRSVQVLKGVLSVVKG